MYTPLRALHVTFVGTQQNQSANSTITHILTTQLQKYIAAINAHLKQNGRGFEEAHQSSP